MNSKVAHNPYAMASNESTSPKPNGKLALSVATPTASPIKMPYNPYMATQNSPKNHSSASSASTSGKQAPTSVMPNGNPFKLPYNPYMATCNFPRVSSASNSSPAGTSQTSPSSYLKLISPYKAASDSSKSPVPNSSSSDGTSTHGKHSPFSALSIVNHLNQGYHPYKASTTQKPKSSLAKLLSSSVNPYGSPTASNSSKASTASNPKPSHSKIASSSAISTNTHLNYLYNPNMAASNSSKGSSSPSNPSSSYGKLAASSTSSSPKHAHNSRSTSSSGKLASTSMVPDGSPIKQSYNPFMTGASSPMVPSGAKTASTVKPAVTSAAQNKSPKPAYNHYLMTSPLKASSASMPPFAHENKPLPLALSSKLSPGAGNPSDFPSSPATSHRKYSSSPSSSSGVQSTPSVAASNPYRGISAVKPTVTPAAQNKSPKQVHNPYLLPNIYPKAPSSSKPAFGQGNQPSLSSSASSTGVHSTSSIVAPKPSWGISAVKPSVTSAAQNKSSKQVYNPYPLPTNYPKAPTTSKPAFGHGNQPSLSSSASSSSGVQSTSSIAASKPSWGISAVNPAVTSAAQNKIPKQSYNPYLLPTNWPKASSISKPAFDHGNSPSSLASVNGKPTSSPSSSPGVPSTSSISSSNLNMAMSPASSTLGHNSKGSASSSSIDTSKSVKNPNAVSQAQAYLTAVGGVVNKPTILSNKTLSAPNLLRIRRDIIDLYKDPPPGILVHHDEKDMTVIHAVVIGSQGSPYEGGFFYFCIRCHNEYPIRPPLVKFMTTAGGTVRFNPNLYSSGKVCLSILGTWKGPQWSAAQTISSLLVSIQAMILNDEPFHNEPGFEHERRPAVIKAYNDIIQHETIRVAVLGMVCNDYCLSIPDSLLDEIKSTFVAMFDNYEAILNSKRHLNGTEMRCPLYKGRLGIFRHDELLERLHCVKNKLQTC